MESTNKIKKTDRKLKKLEHVVFKEAGILCNLKPTKVIDSFFLFHLLKIYFRI